MINNMDGDLIVLNSLNIKENGDLINHLEKVSKSIISFINMKDNSLRD